MVAVMPKQVVQIESAGPLGSAGRFVKGFVRARVAMVALLIGLGIFFGSHGSGEHTPVAAERERLAVKQQEKALQQARQEEARTTYEAETGTRFP